MKKTKGKKYLKIILCIALICAIIIPFFIFSTKSEEGQLKTVRSENELYQLYERNSIDYKPYWIMPLAIPCFLSALPFALLANMNSRVSLGSADSISRSNDSITIPNADSSTSLMSSGESSNKTTSSSQDINENDYSKTNIQVEDVDEADVTKTDGNYIYSISEENVVITDVRNPEQSKIITKISLENSLVPVDLILTGNKLTVISQDGQNRYSSNMNVNIYNIEDKAKPILKKSYSIESNYYTSRCINNKVYIISNGYLKKSKDDIKKIYREYKEDNKTKEIPIENCKYIPNTDAYYITVVAVMDLDNIENNTLVNAYLIDISNAYVSQESIYLANYNRTYNDNKLEVSSIFGLKGLLGLLDYKPDYSTKRETEIYKFNINDGNLSFAGKARTEGKTINQYSMDEKDGHLRVATYDNNGTSITIFDEKMNKMGETEKLAKGEKMYSSRFVGNKAYLVTYKTIDPLFVVDLSDERNPQVLGELKISGYSSYIHPYDENHLIGIGMETKTNVNRDLNGRITSNSTTVVGMKMALFDVSDVKNPKALSTTVIGDSRTTSAILTNPKALLFSKEKELLAIPINNYNSDFEAYDSEDISSLIENYKSASMNYVKEGYAVYKINLEEGFKLKGTITHENTKTKKNSYYNDYYTTQLIRGAYINNNLFTISKDAIKINDIETMQQIGEININEKAKTNSTQGTIINNTSIINKTTNNNDVTDSTRNN
ncbi:MAG: beta-propeller domain-containing protein [Bacilli bacterium]|nr:beta-propeller domain-containing protein [Bacilli bacterium]